MRYYHVGTVNNIFQRWCPGIDLVIGVINFSHLWHLFNHCEYSLLETIQAVTIVSMIAYSIMFNVYGGKPLLWQQTNPEMAGLQGIVNPFIHYHRKICILG